MGKAALEFIRRTPPWRIDAVLATCFVLAGLTTTSRTEPIYEPRDGMAIGRVSSRGALRQREHPGSGVTVEANCSRCASRWPRGGKGCTFGSNSCLRVATKYADLHFRGAIAQSVRAHP